MYNTYICILELRSDNIFKPSIADQASYYIEIPCLFTSDTVLFKYKCIFIYVSIIHTILHHI
jgi:hypothetical protein